MTQAQKAHDFAAMHIKGDPLVLYNIWDAGSAKTVADAGARAIATGSMSVAAAQGYGDGEAIPLDLALGIASRIVVAVDLPVTVDFEGGYGEEHEAVAANVTRLIDTGTIGLNFEDQRICGSGLFPIEVQHTRIKAIRQAADKSGIPMFINSRTDLFLKEREAGKQVHLMAEAIDRAASYKDAGADGFFVPGIEDPELIAQICDAVSLPVNIMMSSGTISDLSSLGAARISYGPSPYFKAMERLAESFKCIK